MSNIYILYMTKDELTAPMDKNQLVAILRRWDAQTYHNVSDARKCVVPLVKFYGMKPTDVDVDTTLKQHNAGAVALVATNATRNLYIIKLDDHHNTVSRYIVGK